MPDRKYTIEYIVDPGAALRGLDAIAAKLAAVDAAVDRLSAKLKDLPKALAPANMTVAASQMATALDQIGGRARAARDATAGVGQNTSNMNNAANRAANLAANLDKVTASGVAAGAAVGGVGGGGIGGAGGAGGKGGAGAGVMASLTRRTAFAVLQSGVNAVREGAEQRKLSLENAAKNYNDFRSELREIANLQGKGDVTPSLIHDQIQFQKQTGMNADEAINFREQFLGAVGAGKTRGNIDDATAEALEKQAAQFAMRYSIDPAVAGKMAGILPEYMKIPNADAGASKLAAIAYHLNYFGVGKVSEMARALTGTQAKLLDENGGRFTDAETLASRLALTTPHARSPAEAGTQLVQANRLLRRFDRMDVEGAPGYALNQLGITPADDFETALRKITPKISGPDGDLWLKANGFNNSTEIAAVRMQASITKNVDAALGRTDPKARAAIEAIRKNASSANAGFLGSEIGLQRTAENRAFETDIGIGQKQSRFERSRLEAETRLRARREIDQPDVWMSHHYQSMISGFMRSGRDDAIESEIYNDLMRRTGVNEDQIAAKFPEFNSIYRPKLAITGAVQYGQEDRAALLENVRSEFDPSYPGGQAAAKHLQQAQQALGAAAQALQQKPAPRPGGPPPGFVAGRP